MVKSIFPIVLFCFSLAGCGGDSTSSGSGGGDSSTPVTGIDLGKQHVEARAILRETNPRSIALQKEFGGYIYLKPDGTYGSTRPIIGTRSNIVLPDRSEIVPSGSIATAWYHTHGALNGAESFSALDIGYSSTLKLDAYLATPSGKFRYYEILTGRFVDFGNLE